MFRFGPPLWAATMWVAVTFLMLQRLRSDVEKAEGKEAVNNAGALPFQESSIYAVHRRLYPQSRLRKVFGVGFIVMAAVTCMFGLFALLGV